MGNYVCPLCKKKFTRFKWFEKHIMKYSEAERRKIFIKDDKIMFQGELWGYIQKKNDQ